MGIFKRLESETPKTAVTVQVISTIASIVLAALAVFGILPATEIEAGAETVKDGVVLTTEMFNKLKGMSQNELILYVVGFILAQFVNVGAGMSQK